MRSSTPFISSVVPAFLLAFILALPGRAADTPLRIGLIGLDTSHTTSFAKLLNDPKNAQRVEGATIVAAFKGGSPDVENSASRIEGFTKQMVQTYGVKIYDTIEEVARNVDAIMILSVDGRAHLDQARKVFPFHKPVFIDKPLAGSLRDAITLFKLAEETKTPVFSSSSRRFGPGIDAVKAADIGRLHGVISHGPATLEPHHPDLFWYGIHAAEGIYAVMGRGCETVVRTHTKDTDVVTGVWSDGRVATLYGLRDARHVYGLTAFGSKANVEDKKEESGYGPLITEVVKFFRTGISPVPAAETIELLAFLEAADESKRHGGAPVRLADVLRQNGGR